MAALNDRANMLNLKAILVLQTELFVEPNGHRHRRFAYRLIILFINVDPMVICILSYRITTYPNPHWARVGIAVQVLSS